jgi:hypothetical protein
MMAQRVLMQYALIHTYTDSNPPRLEYVDNFTKGIFCARSDLYSYMCTPILVRIDSVLFHSIHP